MLTQSAAQVQRGRYRPQPLKRFAKAEFGSHSPRIGGASDLGDESPLLLQAKGRWAGDLGAIYCRLTRRGLVRASRKMQKSSAVDMEELYEAFAQPA